MALRQDVGFSSQALLRRPGFMLVAALSLGLGIGANSTIFSVVNMVRFRSLPFEDPDRLVMLTEQSTERPEQWRDPNAGKIVDLRDRSKSFEQIGMIAPAVPVTLSGDGAAQRVLCQRTGPRVFAVVGARPVLGRLFDPDETPKGGKSEGLLISYGLWQSRFGGATDVVGKTLIVDQRARPVIGVMPPGFWLLPWVSDADLWEANDNTDRPSGRWMTKVARLKSDVSVSEAEAEAESFFLNWDRANGVAKERWPARLTPLRDAYFAGINSRMFLLLGAAAFVLLVSCVNVANMMLARGSVRAKELTVRAAIGAERGRLVQLLLTESVLLAIAGGVFGLALTLLGIRLFIYVSPAWFPMTQEIQVDVRVLGFTAGISILTGVLFGLLPALRATRLDLNGALKTKVEKAVDGRGRMLLLTSEVALASALLCAAGLVFDGFQGELEDDQGFRTKDILVGQLTLGGDKYWSQLPDDAKRVTPAVALYWRSLLEKLSAMPGVSSASVMIPMPHHLWSASSFEIIGRSPPEGIGDPPRFHYFEADPTVFETLEIPLLRGRYLSPQDSVGAPWAIVVDETFVDRFFAGEDPVGQTIQITRGGAISGLVSTEPNAREIVGVVANFKAPHWVEDPPARAFGSFSQAPTVYNGGQHALHVTKAVMVRSSLAPESLVEALREAAASIDPDQVVSDIGKLEAAVASAYSTNRFLSRVLSIFAILSTLLAAVGILGVMSYVVAQRRSEFGLRLALGASRGSILQMVLTQALLATVPGALIGIAVGFGSRRLLDTMVAGLTSASPVTISATSAVLVLAALAAALTPALRAARVNPIDSLRSE